VTNGGWRNGNAGPQASNTSGRLEGDIVVVGLKEGAATARNAKRKASQIVDVVLAQDIGKLPDRNVTEAVARLPGIQITRERGEGAEVRIRGLSNVMTTVNGSQTFSGNERGASLNLVPSDLVAAIEVFKTRTPDQIEGSQTGVVNITMRRPTDFKTGSALTLNTGVDYADQVGRYNPNFSAIVSHTADTDIGRMGFLVNGSFTYFRYNEGIRRNGFPGRVSDARQIVEPSTTPADIFMPFSVNFAGTDGWSRRAALSVATDWKVNDKLQIIVEGGFSNNRRYYSDSNFDMYLFDPLQRLSNVVLNNDGRSVKSVTVDGPAPIGPGRQSLEGEIRNYNARFQAEYKTERFEAVGWVNYVRSNEDYNNLYHWTRFNQSPSYDVVFNTDKDPRGGPDIVFKDIDLLDPDNYRYVDGFTQGRGFRYSREIEAKADLKLNTFSNFVDYFKFGYRYATRNFANNNGSRARGDLRVPIALLPGYELKEVPRGFVGTKAVANGSWLMGSAASFRKAFPTFISLIDNIDPDLEGLKPEYNWWEFFGGSERSHAVYAMAHYNVKLLFPIEGVVGVRAVNSMNALSGVQNIIGNVVEGGITRIDEVRTPVVSDGNFLDVMPSANAIVHFTNNLQLRLAYTRDIGRPSVYELNPVVTFDISNPGQPRGSGGNADLGPISTTKYDASLEWYFGQAGSISLAVWQWDQNGFIARRTLPEALPQGVGNPAIPVLVDRFRNLGRGRHRGIEGATTTFFTFLPGILKSFGASVNGTLNITRQAFPTFDANDQATFVFGPYLNVSKYVYNVQGFFEKAGLNIRVAYNWQSRQQVERRADNPFANRYFSPVDRLDTSISYDISKNLSVAAQANNLTRSGRQLYYGSRNFPEYIGYFSREYSARLTLRF
jgi:TonB-dependent receptor